MSRMNYFYEDSSIIGFLASHQPTVWMGDYGYVSVMPQTGVILKVLPEETSVESSVIQLKYQNLIIIPYVLQAANEQPSN